MIIGIDASRANRAHKSGTEWYSYYLICALADIDSKNQYVLYSDAPLIEELRELIAAHPNFSAKVLTWPWRFFWTQGRLSLEMLFHAPDILFVPSHALPVIHPRKSVVTIHDVGFRYDKVLYEAAPIGVSASFAYKCANAAIKLLSGGSYGANSRDYLEWSTRYALKKAQSIIAISEFTKEELIHLYPVRPQKIAVIPNGYNDKIFKQDLSDEIGRSVLERYGFKEPYIFYIGRLEKKKNTAALIEAFARVKEKGNDLFPHKLYLIGDASFGFDDIKYTIYEYNLSDEVFTTGWIAEEDVPYIYKYADAFVFPSRYEGFGIPLLQAMATGTPIIASRAASIPEVVGDAGVLFDPEDISDMAGAMERVLADEQLRLGLRKAGYARVAQFGWTPTARKTLALLENL